MEHKAKKHYSKPIILTSKISPVFLAGYSYTRNNRRIAGCSPVHPDYPDCYTSGGAGAV